jgi:hypothetical protein
VENMSYQQSQDCVLYQHSLKMVSECGPSGLSNANIWTCLGDAASFWPQFLFWLICLDNLAVVLWL